jgi:hypothetical protein
LGEADGRDGGELCKVLVLELELGAELPVVAFRRL